MIDKINVKCIPPIPQIKEKAKRVNTKYHENKAKANEPQIPTNQR